MENAGLTVHLQEVNEGGIRFFNVIGHNGSLESKNLLALHTHLDTVEPGPFELWTKCAGNPFKLTSQGKKRYGLGAADVKLDFLCKLWAITRSKGPLPPLALVGSYGEERGLVGARRLLETKWFNPRYALVGEPSLLEIIYAHKGHLVVTVGLPRRPPAGKILPFTCKGKAAHSSTPKLGLNAIEQGLAELARKKNGIHSLEGGISPNSIPGHLNAEVTAEENKESRSIAAFLAGLRQLQKELATEKDSRFSPASPTVSVNWVRTTPEEFQFLFDVRLLPSTDVPALDKKIAKILKSSGFSLISKEHDPGLDGRKTDDLIQWARSALKEIGIVPEIQTKASCTEAALYFEKGAQALVFGPGLSIGNVHRPNEYNEIGELEKATKFYFEMIRSMAGKA